MHSKEKTTVPVNNIQPDSSGSRPGPGPFCNKPLVEYDSRTPRATSTVVFAMRFDTWKYFSCRIQDIGTTTNSCSSKIPVADVAAERTP
mmetsp:Transcript_96693/g.171989  ORF Transcript_96693/g.171989 Transcript_96693/m.171989 type:complete len:89 (-) Transcript_96693:90-356(-)